MHHLFHSHSRNTYSSFYFLVGKIHTAWRRLQHSRLPATTLPALLFSRYYCERLCWLNSAMCWMMMSRRRYWSPLPTTTTRDSKSRQLRDNRITSMTGRVPRHQCRGIIHTLRAAEVIFFFALLLFDRRFDFFFAAFLTIHFSATWYRARNNNASLCNFWKTFTLYFPDVMITFTVKISPKLEVGINAMCEFW